MFYLTVGCPAQEKDLAREILAKFAQVHKLLIHEGHRSCEILVKFAQVHAAVNSSCAPPPLPPLPATTGHLPAFSVLGVGHLQISIMTKILTHPCLNLVN